MYPIVPAKTVVCDPRLWSTNLARPKSPSFALKFESNMMLLDLMSRCITHCSPSSCRYSNAEAKPRAILYRSSQVRTCLFPNRCESRLPLGISS
uniref:Uncharacterized protein n=1 Tax=Kalanchoe fedtschenkoi TaxID=63787 RepID=A0A7N0ZVZ0_KALFE